VGVAKNIHRHKVKQLNQTTTTLPPLTPKQQEILKLLYKYKFLNRTQIQTLLSHKDKRRIITWLKDLREKVHRLAVRSN
jgi:hypothetical protein